MKHAVAVCLMLKMVEILTNLFYQSYQLCIAAKVHDFGWKSCLSWAILSMNILQRFNSKSNFCFEWLRRNLYYIIFYYIMYYIILYQLSADPACSRGSASGEELPAARAKKSLQAARARSKNTRKKKQEARSNYRQQAARSKKQEARKQQAAGRQVRELVFLSIQKATLGRRLEDSSES